MARLVPRNRLPVDPNTFPNNGPVRHAVGIDLGTTNSVVALASWDPAAPDTIEVRCLEVDQPTAEAGTHVGTLVPSVVARHGDETYVGEGAKRLVAAGPGLGLEVNRDLFFETKNEIGTGRIYTKAPDGYRTPGEIGGHILRYLRQVVAVQPEAIVVTVPASFQIAQRAETRKAVDHAGFDPGLVQLLDEPVAAFLDFLATQQSSVPGPSEKQQNVLVFDFGGGTCDIAILNVARRDGRLTLMPRSISRFHRLGGGDIDAAIVYDVLIPKLLEQNQPFRKLGYPEKKRQLEPALRPIAEGLKTGLCRELNRRRALGLPDEPELRRTLAGRYTVTVDGEEYVLTDPTLTLARFENVLEPFLDRNILAPRADEYRMARSIFAPLEDALMRAQLAYEDVDLVLLVGGSANIPQVGDALAKAFARAELTTYEDPVDRKECVARGAAIAALVTASTGQRVLDPVCFDSVGIATREGFLELIPAGTRLPAPEVGKSAAVPLRAPRASRREPLPLRLEVQSGDGRCLFTSTWQLVAPVAEGEGLVLRWRLDADQVLHLRASRPGRADQQDMEAQIENPLTHVLNPIAKEVEAEELERQIASGRLTPAERETKALKLVGLLDDLGRREKAFAILRALQAQKGGPDAALLNWMGLLAWRMGDLQEAERLFVEAAKADESAAAPLFNLSLLLEKGGRLSEAFDAIARGLERETGAPYFTQRALLAAKLGDAEVRARALEAARPLWPALPAMSDWELWWYRTWAREVCDDVVLRVTQAELRRRNRAGELASSVGGELPSVAETIG